MSGVFKTIEYNCDLCIVGGGLAGTIAALSAARKGVKVYMKNPLEVSVNSITTQHEQKLYIGEKEVNMLKGKKVLIVDDVISTGESLSAIEELVKKAGGEIAGKLAVLAEGDAIDRKDISVLGKLPLFDANGEVLA